MVPCAVQRIDAMQLADAFANSTFFFEYQPIVELSTGKVPHVEALVRWDHPSLGVLQPGSFLSLIHGAELSDALTEWSLQQVLRDLPELRDLYGVDVSAAINLSQRQLVDPDATAARVANAIEDADEDPQAIGIEVVEDLTSHDLRRSARAIAGLRSIGVSVFLDDFGTGASSLSALTEMDYDGLKIDRSFVRGIVSGTTARSIVEAVLAFGATTGISVVAEGVESALELRALDDIGCLLGQGFFLGRPTPLASGPPDVIDLRGARAPSSPVAVTDARPRTGGTDVDVTIDIDDIVDELAKINPRSTTESFDELCRRLELLDQSAAAFGEAGIDVRCEVGRRLTLTSVYAGDAPSAVRWAMHTSRLAEGAGRWGYSAEVLSMIAAGRSGPQEAPGLRIEAMTRALELRMTKSIDAERSSSIDNAIGAVFANLGLWDHAYRWWRDSLDRQTAPASSGTAMSCLNLVELELERLEGFVMMSDSTPKELSFALITQILDRIAGNPHVPAGALLGFQCRLELLQGNLEAAVAAMAQIDEPAVDIVPLFLQLRAQAMLAQEFGEADDFLKHTTNLAKVLDRHPLLTHHDQQAQQLRVKALTAVGRHDEAVRLLEDLLRRQRVEDGENLRTLFGWVRVNVDLNLRFAELGALQSSPGWA